MFGVGRAAVSDVKSFDDEANALAFVAEQEAAGKHPAKPVPVRITL